MGLKRLDRTIRDAASILRLTSRCRGYGVSTAVAAVRHLRVCRSHRFEPVEAFRLGIFSREFNFRRLDDFGSQKNTTKLQNSLNPSALSPLFKNKAVFYQYCSAHGLPVPRLYGLFSTLGKTIHNVSNGISEPVADRADFFASLPERFAIKPAVGSLGDGFRIITRHGNQFSDHFGQTYSAKELFALLAATSSVGTLIQEVVENHPDITAFSGTGALQTIRVITLASPDGRVEILTAFFKTITAPHIVIDTFMDGLTGNVEILINPDDGSLGEACYLDGSGRGIVTLKDHPLTEKPFKDFVIPCWPQVCELAQRAAVSALPARSIGWDIAVREQGPCLIEGNVWWNPPNQHRVMGQIALRMADAASAPYSNCGLKVSG